MKSDKKTGASSATMKKDKKSVVKDKASVNKDKKEIKKDNKTDKKAIEKKAGTK